MNADDTQASTAHEKRTVAKSATLQKSCDIYAHTKPDTPCEEWEMLYGKNGHAENTARIIGSFSPIVDKSVLRNDAKLLKWLGRIHDVGKASSEFQEHLRGGAAADHKTAASYIAQNTNSFPYSSLLPYVLYGHHSGLPQGTKLFGETLACYKPNGRVIESIPKKYTVFSTNKLKCSSFIPQGKLSKNETVFSLMMFVRMMHSALVDADWLATEEYMSPERSRERQSFKSDSVETLSSKLEAFINERERSSNGRINALRKKIHKACFKAGDKRRGIYRLNVPTGGGKTLSSLSFALRHAVKHGLKRVIYVIPYTSIIEQTADEFRKVLGSRNVLEHQSNITDENDSTQNRYASENWDMPVIVTTSAQFFETLFSCKNSKCRKIHNIAQSVIVFDEAQSLPTDLLFPCIECIKVLRRHYSCSALLCTATQPALEHRERFFDIGWRHNEAKSLLGDRMEQMLRRKMKRVSVEAIGKKDTAELIEHYVQHGGSALFIVNLTRHAQELYNALQEYGCENVYHLSARMCPHHRLEVLETVRERLAANLPTILVATRVIEAGVDISFPIVYRDRCGVDSLAQSAGRCNRHGELESGKVFFFKSSEKEYDIPIMLVDLYNGANALDDMMLEDPNLDIFSSDAVNTYFQRFYSKGRHNHWDADDTMAAKVGSSAGMLRAWNFPDIDAGFQMIPDNQRALFVPYGDKGKRVLETLRTYRDNGWCISRALRRKLQSFSINVYEGEFNEMLKNGQVANFFQENSIFCLTDEKKYSKIGLVR